MTPRNALGAALLMGTLAAVACGGVAVVDSEGNGGAGGVSATSTATSNNSTTSTMMSSSTGMLGSLCDEACKTLLACDAGPFNCVDGCLQREEAPCGDLHTQWLNCSLGETNSMCGLGPGEVCGTQLQAYLACTGEVAGELGCSAGPDFCECSTFVSPGIELTQVCDSGVCECLVGGQFAGSCEGVPPECDVVGGCCAGIFFTSSFF